MVRRYSTEDKVTIDSPIEKPSLVPWKQLASSPTSTSHSRTKGAKVFNFLDESQSENLPKNGQPGDEIGDISSVSLEESQAVALEEVNEEGERKRRSQSSPMQEKLLMEQNWQKNLVKMDEILSDTTASNRGEFDQVLFIDTFTKKEFLSQLFKLFDWEVKGSVPQDKIVDYSKRTFQGSGGRQWTELLEVIAYVICEERDVTEPCFIKIFKSRGVAEKLYQYIWAGETESGNVTRQKIMDLIANLTYARPRKGFSAENLERFEKLFREALGSKQELSFQDFQKIIHSKNSFFAERVFQIFDRDRSGSVSLSEFLDAMHQFTGQSPNDKIKFLFKVYDLDGDGLIQRSELEQVMKACMEENGMRFSHEQIEDLTLALFEDADTDQRGEITFEALKAQLEKHPGLLENLSISIDRWLVPPEPQVIEEKFSDKLKKLTPYQLTPPYLKNNYVYLLFLFLFIATNVGLFIDRALTIYFQGHNWYYILARASGQCLNFNCAFILVLVLRYCLTFLRSHGASSYLPLDQSLYFHKMCGFVILFHSILHTVMHCINFPTVIVYSEELNPRNLSAAQWLLTDEPETFGLIDGWANPTGLILIVVIIIMVICSLPFVRKSGYFEVFYWTHLLYIVFWGLTILHGPHFWKWFVGPAVLFIIEKLYRFCKMRTGHGKTYISSGILLPSKVIHLVIQRPHGFHFHPGDYIFVNIPEIAQYEWHPFTISSAPEQEGALWLHIRAVGEWTNRLYSYFEKQQLRCEKRKASQKLSIQYSHSRTVVSINDIVPTVKNKQEVYAKTNDEVEVVENNKGVINVAYESEIDLVASKTPSDTNSMEPAVSYHMPGSNLPEHMRGLLRKKNLDATHSAPDLDAKMKKKERSMMLRENWKNNSDKTDQKNLDSPEFKASHRSQEIVFPTNQSVAMSVRYMRHKPLVVTLDAPEESGDELLGENIFEQEQDGEVGNDVDVEAPKPTSVIRASGRIFDRKSLRGTGKHQNRKSKQHEHLKVERRISRLKEAEVFGQCTIGKPLVIYVDGPYGAPSSHIFRAQHAVLIGTGIGVTPFASILQSIMHRYHEARQTCPRCDHAWTSSLPQSVMNLRKVDFFWINRDQRSFEWFVNLLSQLEIEQAEQGSIMDRFLDMHMYITSALQKTDMKAVGLQLALDLLHEKEKRDLITGLKTRTNAGRPNWNKVFKQLSNQKKGKITVFYCGPPSLGRTLRFKCDAYGFDFRKEIF